MPVTTDAIGRSVRDDGFTPEKQRRFLVALAACGVVADSCRFAGVSRDTAYALRHRAEGRAFALAWNAALLIARGPVGDEVASRVMNGVVERIYRNGELWGERHRHDNRLAMAVLTRLDRQAEGLGEGAAAARVIAQEWDQFLDIVEAGGDGAGDFLEMRTGSAVGRKAKAAAGDLADSAATLDRLSTYRHFGVGLLEESDVSDLEPARMESWTEEQWDRADYSGLLDSLDEDDWPEAARKVTESGTNGTCRSRQDISAPDLPIGRTLGVERMRFEYSVRFPPRPVEEAPADPDDGLISIWQDDALDCLVTDYPPPAGFDGEERGEWGDDGYWRTLSPAEQSAIDVGLALGAEYEANALAAALAAARAERDRVFGFAGDPEQDPSLRHPRDGGDPDRPAGRTAAPPDSRLRGGDSREAAALPSGGSPAGSANLPPDTRPEGDSG